MKKINETNETNDTNTLKPKQSKLGGSKDQMVLRELKDMLKPIAIDIDKDDEEQIQHVVSRLKEKYNITGKSDEKKLQKMAMFFYFHNHQQLKIKQIVESNTYRTKSQSLTMHKPANAHDIKIRTYYWYPAQKGLFHKIHDLIRTVKKFGWYDQAVKDTAFMIKLYIEYNGEPSVFIKDSLRYLKKVTFAIAPGQHNKMTGNQSGP